ncbi:2-keto-4-pentenoate hydratase [Ramlibacter sp.]|uniref:2-keto-4-pentenoate hydratase n=1 Tax=Ramlibacter sp. TaxID=1917967 RepID=UPI003D0A9AB6
MNDQQLQQAAASLRDAAKSGAWIPPLRETYTDIDADAAYAIQKINTELRLAEGRRIVGRKIGLTAKAVQAQLGVDQPDFGILFDDMGYGDAEAVPLNVLHQPKVEAEIAFVMGRDIDAAEPSMVDVMQAIEYALPAIEIVGSRVDKWNIKFVDTVADNASAGAFVLGSSPRKLSQFDLRMCGMAMMLKGEPVSTGAGVACLGNPLNAVLWLARTMARVGSPMRAGDLVLSGALGPMAPVKPGDIFETRINGLGTVKAVFEGAK